MDKLTIINEIKGFLEGYNNDFKYVVNIEADPSTNFAECIIHEPNKEKRIEKIGYMPFMYMKDLSKTNHKLYAGYPEDHIDRMKIKHGITITMMKTGNQKRLIDGYCYKITSRKSFNNIINYLKEGGIDPYEKLKDSNGKFIKDKKDRIIYKHRDLFYFPRTIEQFLISTQIRLFKGFEEYKNIHKVTFDIETFGLRYQIARVFAIGVKDNRGFERILEVDKLNDDESEIKLIQDFFNVINHLQPAVISGYNSEMFDFEFILGRAKILKMKLSEIPTGLRKEVELSRRPNTSVKYGNTSDRYTATEMWGYSIIDILHAVRKTSAINSEIKENKLKYIAKFEKIVKPNRTYIPGEENVIGKYYSENKMFVIDENNNYLQIPDAYQETTKKLYELQIDKKTISDEQYKTRRASYLNENKIFIDWFRKEASPKKMNTFINGKNLVKQYLLDDLWETEQIDELYNQSTFLLAKMIPTTYQRVCTMGTAGIWNLFMTAWSYENDLAIPYPDKYEHYSGGLVRTYKLGFFERIVKIDYGSLYPSIELTDDVFPIFDITGAMKKILLYLTTTRNIYKKLANNVELDKEDVSLLRQIDPEAHVRYINKELTSANLAMFKIKQLPIKILNNSLYGALGSNVSYNWSDNICAARITCTGRLHLRHSINWFYKFGCIPLLAVTDGINFSYPEKTNIRITNDGVNEEVIEGAIETMWEYDGKIGIEALIAKYNKEELKPPFMSIDMDDIFISCLNLSRINYATLALVKDKKTGEQKEKVKLSGNTIKSKVMPEYIEDFIDKGFKLLLHGKGKEFFEYYNDYVGNLYYQRIPLKKIASKSKVKTTISAYRKRGKDKNGRVKGKQAHMELLIEQREQIACELFEKHKNEFDFDKIKMPTTAEEKMKFISNYMPPEPELDSVIYLVNTGTKKSKGNSATITDKETGEKRFCATLISTEDLQENPDMLGNYNAEKYLSAFNKRVSTLLAGFEPEIAKKFLSKTVTDRKTKETKFVQASFASYELELKNFDLDNIDESMYLEKYEIDYWNKTGYNPRKIWDRFKMHDDYKIHYEIYENALNYLNELMTVNNLPRIKSINDDYKKGELILIKNGREYSVGSFNGTYIQIVRENVYVPKSEVELELDRIQEENEKKIKELEITLENKTEREIFLEAQAKRRVEYFEEFKKEHHIPIKATMEQVFAEMENSSKVFEDFVAENEAEIEEEEDEYFDIDLDDDTD